MISGDRTFVAAAFGAIGFCIGHFAIGADWICALCLVLAFAGLAMGIWDNRPEDAILHCVMIIAFPFLLKYFPRIWSFCTDAVTKGGRTLDATARNVMHAMLFIVVYAAVYLAMRLILASVLSLGRMKETTYRGVVCLYAGIAYLAVACMGTFAACLAYRRFFKAGFVHYVAFGTVAMAWAVLAILRFARKERMRAETVAKAGAHAEPVRSAKAFSVRPETTLADVAGMEEAKLQELDGIDAGKNPILLLGATNVPWMVDEAFMRPGRFDVKLFVGLPDSAARKAIIDRLFSQGDVRPVSGLVEYIADRTADFSGADLKGVVDGIRQLAYERRLPLYTHSLADHVLENSAPSPSGAILDAIREWESR